ncbi:protein of unknown function [Moritella yayanosii]|uniref:Uncharacterized protein n=1 Tax=Moritella yayanosii TaxID=69539 RepID=A0A330LUE0_9GAMM|nr:protein of unknown function [Moritella yayanosii]
MLAATFYPYNAYHNDWCYDLYTVYSLKCPAKRKLNTNYFI